MGSLSSSVHHTNSPCTYGHNHFAFYRSIIAMVQGGVPPKQSEKVFFESKLSIFAVSCKNPKTIITSDAIIKENFEETQIVD